MADKDGLEPTDGSDEQPTSARGSHAFGGGKRSAGRRGNGDRDHNHDHGDDGGTESRADLGGEVDEAALEPAGVGAVSVGSPTREARDRRPARTPESAPTAPRDRPDKPVRTTPAKFVRESVGELRKVVYPTGQQLLNYFVVVLVFVLFVIAFVSLLDLALGQLIFKIFA